MKLMNHASRRAGAVAAGTFELQAFEPRVLMSVTTAKDSAVVFKTNLGEIAVVLDPVHAPISVQNFLSYVDAKAYNGTIIHRATTPASDGFAIIQGGGYKSSTSATHIPTNAPIVNEFNPARPNVRGTIAMARTSVLNSATSEFFINGTDNSGIFDNVAASNQYAVFGTVIRGMGAVDLIDNLPKAGSGTFAAQPKIAGFLDVSVTSADKRDLTTVTIGAGSNDRAVRFNDGDNVIGTVSLAGGGAASIKVTGTNLTTSRLADGTIVIKGTNTELQSIDTTGTTARSTLHLTGGGAYRQLDVGSITADSTLGTIAGGATVVHGDVTLAGGARHIDLLAVRNAGTVSIGSATSTFNATPVDLNVPFLDNASLTSTQPISRLVTRTWQVTDFTTRSFTAPSVGQLISYGDFGADLTVSGQIKHIEARAGSGAITAKSISSALFGTLSGGSVVATGSAGIGSVSVTGALSNATIRSAGSIGRVTAGTMTSSNVYAGITSNPSSGQFPTSFNNSKASIGSVRVFGGPMSFSKSRIAAPTLGSVALGRVQTRPLGSNKLLDTSVTLGVKADKIGSLSAITQDGQPLNFHNLDTQSAFNTQVAQRKLKLYAFSVVLV